MLGVIVCGGRHFDRYDVIEKVLNEVLSTCDDQKIEIVSGHCEGADADTEYSSGWDPSLFKSKEDCLAYLKSHYGDNFSGPTYVIETVKVGNGWEVVDCERLGET